MGYIFINIPTTVSCTTCQIHQMQILKPFGKFYFNFEQYFHVTIHILLTNKWASTICEVLYILLASSACAVLSFFTAN